MPLVKKELNDLEQLRLNCAENEENFEIKLDTLIKGMVEKYTGDSETRMGEDASISHCRM